MAFLIRLIPLLAIASTISARTVYRNPNIRQAETENKEDPPPQADFSPPREDAPSSFDSSYNLPSYLQLPNSEPAQVPFHSYEPSAYLSAPRLQENPPMNYFEGPVPAFDLQAPGLEAWNPNNDPALYFEIPAFNTKESPTDTLPKKFNKDIHVKSKPYSRVPKEELVLVPISKEEAVSKTKTLLKTLSKDNDKLAKLQNQKEVEKLHRQEQSSV